MTTAVLVIDVQRGLFDAAPRPADADVVVARINQLTSRARTAGVPVVFIQHETKTGDLVFDSSGWRLEQNLRVEADDYQIRKTTPDSFLRTQLGDLLSTLGASQLIVCGYATEFCVDTTVRRAAAFGYEVTIAADAHTTHDKPHASARQIRAHHNATLPEITSFGPAIKAVTVEEIDLVA